MIDPTISFVKFLGGSDTDEAYGVTVDGLGNSYVTGQTYSGNFPVHGGIVDGSKSGDSDAFVTKLTPQGNVLFSTFLGGGDNDLGWSVATDTELARADALCRLGCARRRSARDHAISVLDGAVRSLS